MFNLKSAKNLFRSLSLVIAGGLFMGAAIAAPLYSDGFETIPNSWATTVERVPSGSGGINSSAGSFYGSAQAGDFTRWGGYNFGAGSVATTFQEYWTSINIYLDIDGVFANDTRFDFSSAISNAAGAFLQDFVFNVGFYTDVGQDGQTDGFVISASNNAGRSGAFPKNPGRGPITILESGWYTFEHHFYAESGVLKVGMSVSDSSDNSLGQWAPGGGQAIAGVGGNRYGWFTNSEFSTLAIDESELRTANVVPEPSSIALILVGLAGLGLSRRRKQA